MKKTAAIVVPGQDTWKDLGLVSIVSLVDHALVQPVLHIKHETESTALQHLIDVVLFGKDRRTLKTRIGEVTLQAALFRHVVEKRDDARERYAGYIEQAMMNPVEIWLTKYSDASERHVFIGLFKGKRQVAIIVHKNSDDGKIFWNLITKSKTKGLNQQRIGVLIWRRY